MLPGLSWLSRGCGLAALPLRRSQGDGWRPCWRTRLAGWVPSDVRDSGGPSDPPPGVSSTRVDVDEVASGYSAAVTLPAYTLVNAGLSYQAEDWSLNLTVKNLTDERYFRSNFPDLFGSQIVLPELPRHWNAKFTYSF